MTVPGRHWIQLRRVRFQQGVRCVRIRRFGDRRQLPALRPRLPHGAGGTNQRRAGPKCVGTLEGTARSSRGLSRVEPLLTAAIGHSMGGFYAIRQQALFSSYDAVAILGYSTLFPQLLYGRADQTLFVGLTSEEQVVEQGRSSGMDPYATNASDQDKARRMNYLGDVPDDVIAAHEALKTNTPGYSSAATLIPGIVAADAAAIDVPVFLGFAERDTFARSPDGGLFIPRRKGRDTPRARRFSTRHKLCDNPPEAVGPNPPLALQPGGRLKTHWRSLGLSIATRPAQDGAKMSKSQLICRVTPRP